MFSEANGFISDLVISTVELILHVDVTLGMA
jgi:hypothetical protein